MPVLGALWAMSFSFEGAGDLTEAGALGAKLGDADQHGLLDGVGD
jgi:hypothetical protein